MLKKEKRTYDIFIWDGANNVVTFDPHLMKVYTENKNTKKVEEAELTQTENKVLLEIFKSESWIKDYEILNNIHGFDLTISEGDATRAVNQMKHKIFKKITKEFVETKRGLGTRIYQVRDKYGKIVLI